MYATVFNGWDIVDLTADWESATWFRDKLNELTTLGPIYQVYWMD